MDADALNEQESRSFLMRTAVSEASTCESWSIAIEQQRKALQAEQADQRECSPYVVEALPSPTLLARNHELFSHFVRARASICPSVCPCDCVCVEYTNVLLLDPQELSPPRIAMVSVVRVSERDAKPLEEVIKRKVAWGEALDLGVVPQGGACVILLQDGSIGRIGTQALMGSWDAGQACWIEVMDAESPTEIEGTTTQGDRTCVCLELGANALECGCGSVRHVQSAVAKCETVDSEA